MLTSSLPSLLLLLSLSSTLSDDGGGLFCSAPSVFETETASSSKPLYWKVTNPTLSPSHLQDLPGFTRSVYKGDHALITPESHVFSPLPGWTNTLGAYLITPAMGSHFVMYLAKMQENSKSGLPPNDVERFLFVVQGSATLTNASGAHHQLMVDSYAYLAPNSKHSLECDASATLVVFERRFVSSRSVIECDASATLVVFERRYSPLENHFTKQIVGSTDQQPLLETPGEVFELRKLLPPSLPYDFNIHIMDFQPGEFLNVKEVHYNQHGLLLLEGQGIYRLADSWYPVQSGDAIWMAPFVPQWYAALGKTRTRYLLYKDVNRNPL
ncbi:PREDICTED: (S)-ureidoglycine aminohydrolase isoform X2 [Populus euphratica]|uniref:(S)-ureidoglycine aminohydrolase isoform X2 n=1 Tax=Populus euphratica TaxID=75702 RepID=A0AAJ6UM20_POPEU|nr:PREDICTED: (S)-ureidoglycine aminohydrolase isoform X2 [Populus euphratica]